MRFPDPPPFVECGHCPHVIDTDKESVGYIRECCDKPTCEGCVVAYETREGDAAVERVRAAMTRFVEAR